MLNAIKENRSRVFSEIEVIDIKTKIEIQKNWQDFFYRSHFRINNTFQESNLWYYPRRSCDAFFSSHLMNAPWLENHFPMFNSIAEMHEWIKPLIEDEEIVNLNNSAFSYKAR